MQFPKELQPQDEGDGYGDEHASMKCSSRRNCNTTVPEGGGVLPCCLNEVQFPKELQRPHLALADSAARCLNEVQFPKELQLPGMGRELWVNLSPQ